MNKNLYKLDDVFLVISYLLLLPLLYIFKPVLLDIIYDTGKTQEVFFLFVQSRIIIISILSGSSIFLQVLGRIIRKEEKILVKILDIVVMYKTISITQLQHRLDMNRPKVERYINKLANIGRLNIKYDGTYVKLELETPTDTMSGTSFEQTVSSKSFSPPPIPESSSDSQSKEKETDQTETTENTISSKEDLQNILESLTNKQTSGKKFNVVLFIVLFFAFWPIAFIYAANYYMKSQKGSVIEARLKKRLKNM